MKVHAEHTRIQDFLLQKNIDGITIVEHSNEADYLITGRYTIEKYHPGLKGIIIPWTGHNGINLDDMRKHNTELYVTPTRSRYVAEKAVTLTLALLGKTVEYHQNLKNGNWSARNSHKRVPWNSILDRKIGFFGYGRIGKLVHQFLSGFDCDFFTLDRSKDYPDTLQTVSNLKQLVDVCDIIIISAPLNKETEGVFNEDVLTRMSGKFLINVGRGKIVDEKALYESLTNQGLAGYASDVWYTYPKGKEKQYPSTLPLYQLENVLMSNHSGGFTDQTNEEVNRDLALQLERLRDGDTSNKLDLEILL